MGNGHVIFLSGGMGLGKDFVHVLGRPMMGLYGLTMVVRMVNAGTRTDSRSGIAVEIL